MNRNQFRDLILLIMDIILVAANTMWFRWVWFTFYKDRVYVPFFMKGDYAMLLVFMVIFAIYAKVYGGFDLKTSRTSELVYSNVIALLATTVTMFAVTWLLIRARPRVLPMLYGLIAWILTSIVWSKIANIVTNFVWPPLKTVIIYGNQAAFNKGRGIAERVPWRFKVVATFNIKDGTKAMLQTLNKTHAKAVMLCGIHSSQRNDIIKYCIDQGTYAYIRPNIGDYLVSSSTSLQMASLPVMLCSRAEPSAPYLLFKRLFDIIFSLAILLVTSPILLIVSILIHNYDKGPILYKQVRLTKNGKEFEIYKFRSMKQNAEKDGVARLAAKDDDRITPVGKFIRATRIDELPQMINILKGDMSVVGPRPERPEIAAQYEETMPEFRLRLQVKAGLTGYAQVYGKYNTSPYDKLQMDLMYIAKLGVITDLRIILATVKVVFMPESTEGIDEGSITAEDSEFERSEQ